MGISEKTLISGRELLNYIPQREPIVMIDCFYGIEDNVSVCGLTVDPDNIFVKDGILDECGLIEHIAQSAAMRVGYLSRKANKEIPVGFIGSVDKMKVFSLPEIGRTIVSHIVPEQELMNISLISAMVKSGDEILAECKMKIFLQQ
jgi:predicted hotdog family 3-hydroxylacyl-ACP dehydratase